MTIYMDINVLQPLISLCSKCKLYIVPCCRHRVILVIPFCRCKFFFFFFFFIDKTHITVTKFKTKRKYITILQIGSKLHKDEKE